MYIITIVEKKVEDVYAGKEWKPTGHAAGCNSPDCKEYAYTPEVIKKEPVERKIYEQVAVNLDLKKVIKAVNNIGDE